MAENDNRLELERLLKGQVLTAATAFAPADSFNRFIIPDSNAQRGGICLVEGFDVAALEVLDGQVVFQSLEPDISFNYVLLGNVLDKPSAVPTGEDEFLIIGEDDEFLIVGEDDDLLQIN